MAAASLGSATNSRVDSAAKHTMACKVDTAFLKRTLENPTENGEEMLNQGKLKYAMLKDELSMCTTKKFYGTSGHAAYPLVVTTVGDLDDETKNFLKGIYSCATVTDFLHDTSTKAKEEYAKNRASNSKIYKNVVNALPEFRCQGVALGQAFASHLSGDTVATVLVGGMATVMNGAFEIFAGPHSARARPPARPRARPPARRPSGALHAPRPQGPQRGPTRARCALTP
jgi:hypothetical protein